jgi:KAP family P-loop domain
MIEEAGSIDRNDHIAAYLKYYFNFPHAPYFSVLLNGQWGIGKTFLIKKILRRLFPDDEGYVYVSLYGLSETGEIDSAIFRAMYPILGWKGTKIAGRVASIILKHSNLEPSFKIDELVDRYKAKIYIFDDLERCEIPINKTLGYINEFVEHGGCKVVIVGNELEIADGDAYRKRREKLIGKTLEVQSSFEEAFSHFVSLVDEPNTKSFIQKKSAEIATVYSQSRLNNLRILQQTMWDFERVFGIISEAHRKNDEAMSVILGIIFAVSFELKAGRISDDDISSRTNDIISAMRRRRDGGSATNWQNVESRYPEINFDDSILSNELLIEILIKGIVIQKKIRDSINRSSYFVSAVDEPAWRTVWYAIDRDDGDFDRAFAEMERQFCAREWVIAGELLHAFGIRLWLSDVGALDKNRSKIVSDGKAYVDDLYNQKRLDLSKTDVFDDIRFGAYAGLGIRENETPEYRELFDYLAEKRRQATTDQYPERGLELLKEMETDPNLYFRRLCVTNTNDSIFYNIPILASINAGKFVESVLRQSPEHQRIVMSAFKSRYENGRLQNELSSERPWLEVVGEKFAVAVADAPLIKKYRVNKLVEWYITPFLQ